MSNQETIGSVLPIDFDIEEEVGARYRRTLRSLATVAICERQLETCTTGVIDLTDYEVASEGCSEAHEEFATSLQDMQQLIEVLRRQLHYGALRNGPSAHRHYSQLRRAKTQIAAALNSIEGKSEAFSGSTAAHYAQFVAQHGALLQMVQLEITRFERAN